MQTKLCEEESLKVLIKKEKSNKVSEEELTAELVKSASNGCQAAFRKLVLKYQSEIFRLIVKKVGSVEKAEELTQDTFLKAWKSLSKFEHNSGFKTWIYRIALNSTNSWFNSKDYKKYKLNSTFQSNLKIKASSRAHLILYEDFLIKKGIEKLKKNHREVIELIYFEKLSYKEVSHILQIPLGTVSSRLTAAHSHLKKSLSKVKKGVKV